MYDTINSLESNSHQVINATNVYNSIQEAVKRQTCSLRSRRFRGEDLEREKFGTREAKTGEA